jgi:hypothetical protein
MSTIATQTVLDHIDGIAVDGNVFNEPVNEYWQLCCMWHGMETLYGFAKQCDVAFLATVQEGARVVQFGGPGPAGVSIPLLICSFQWYAMSAYQYGLLIGNVAYQQDPSRPLPNEYLETAMPEILAYRNKVAAHFVWAKNNKRDNAAERLASVMQIPVFDGDSYYAGGFTIGTTKGGDHSTSEAIMRWSIVKTHDRLRQRYWPG